MTTTLNQTDTRAAWLAERRKGLGGSDAAAAVGLSKWTTRLQLWLDKRGESESVESEAMRWGTLLEPVIRAEYSRRTERQVFQPGRILRSERYPFALANLDGVTSDDRLFEAKTARGDSEWGEEGTDEIPVEYFCQVQHYMAVTELPVADIAVLIGASDFRIYTVDFDPEFAGSLMQREAEFWAMVESGEPPDPKTSADCEALWPKSNAGLQVTATLDDYDLVASLVAAKEVLSIQEAEVDRLAAIVKARIGDAEALVDDKGKPLVTWKSSKPRSLFDSKAFSETHPELFAEFIREGKPSRPLLIKSK